MLAACLLGGSLQTSIFVCISVVVFYFFRNRSHWSTEPNASKRVTLQLVIAVSLGFGIAAIFLLPSLELILLSHRWLGVFNTQWSLLNSMLTVPLWISFVFPRLVGSHDTIDLTRIIGTNLTTFQGYTGFISIICSF